MARQKVTIRIACVCLTLIGSLLSPESLFGIVTSFETGSHVVTPGQTSFGINSDGVALLGTDSPASSSFEDVLIPTCTGALITDRHMLSAAHCFDEDRDGEVDVLIASFPFVAAFELTDRDVLIRINTNAIHLPTAWPDTEADIAVVELADSAPQEIPRYPLYGASDEVGKPVVLVGYGATGLGDTGIDEIASATPVKRAGLNRYDAILDDVPGEDFLVFDFDSGRKENNTLALFEFESDLGFGTDEVFTAPGDSGGPGFIHGAIAGVDSFSNRNPETDVDDIANNSWGELGYDVRVSQFAEFILQATDNQAVFVVPGDFDVDAALTGIDMDLLSAAVRDGSEEGRFDLNSDGEVSQLDRTVWITAIAGTVFGDADLNMEVTFTDFQVLADNFTDVGGWAEGDFDGSGDVQFADFLLLSSNFGKSAPVLVAVPEPAGYVTIPIVAFVFLSTRRFDIS